MNLTKWTLTLSSVMLLANVGQAAEAWRQHALNAATRLATAVEALDETLHDAFENQQTPEFKKAIEDMHHIEDVITHLRTTLPTAPFADLCHDIHHLYEDLTAIRLDLIALNLQKNAQVVNAWNQMVNIHNKELIRYFRNCPKDWECSSDVMFLESL